MSVLRGLGRPETELQCSRGAGSPSGGFHLKCCERCVLRVSRDRLSPLLASGSTAETSGNSAEAERPL